MPRFQAAKAATEVLEAKAVLVEKAAPPSRPTTHAASWARLVPQVRRARRVRTVETVCRGAVPRS